MKIYVDADGCPVVDLAVNIAKQYNLEIIIVKNYAHKIESNYAQIVSVDISQDSADFYIVNNISQGDIVVTQDYGLAALSLSKGVYPINQNGFIFTKDNIDGMLNKRHIHQNLRQGGYTHNNPKKRKSEDNINFKFKLEKLIETHKK